MSIYQFKKGKKRQRKSFCAYLDVLGFRQKIKDNDFIFLKNYLSTLDSELQDIDKNPRMNEFELKIFTDNLVFGYPWNDVYGEGELGTIFDILAHIQVSFALSDVFFRGAIALSNLYMDENVVFGPSLVEAYNLETEMAIYPRIILSKNVITVIKKHTNYYADPKKSPQYTEYLKDIDGLYFVNYLQIIIDRYDCVEVLKILTKHKDVIVKNLTQHTHNYKLWNKYAWSANYHNYFCDNFLENCPNIVVGNIKIGGNLINRNISRIL
jgi:hypothetical protein